MKHDSDPPWAWLNLPAPHHLAISAQEKWEHRTIADFIRHQVEDDPEFPVLIAGDERLTRARLLVDAEALAVALTDLGLVAGDVISFQLPNWIEAAVLNLAAAMSGLIVNPIVPIYRDAEVGMMLADCRAKAFFVCGLFRNHDFVAMTKRLRGGLPELRHVVVVRGEGPMRFHELVDAGRGRVFVAPRVDAGGVKILLYTSGTTGRPKAVLHSHNCLVRVMRVSALRWGLQRGDAMIMPSPVTHVSGYANGLEMPFVAGTTTILMESWDAREAVRLIEAHGVTGTVAATPFLVELADAARDAGTGLSSLRFFACGGAAVPPDVIPAANAAFDRCRSFRVFGSSEVPLVTLGWIEPGQEHLAATTDGAIVDYDVHIVDDDGAMVAEGQDGEILARGPAMFLGYADRDQTAEALTPEGYFRTGDIGHLTPEGALVITGRKKDMIIRGGENISAREIEDVLNSHPAIREAAVVAMPHERLGEGVGAYVIVREGAAADAAELVAYVRASGLARQKIPERFEFVQDFPRTASGKIKKDVLRADIQAKISTGRDSADVLT